MLRPFALLSLLLLAPGCVVGPKYKAPEPDAPAAFTSKTDAASNATSNSQWWRKFNDTQLDQLVEQAETNNRDLKSAEARIKEARALWTSARYERFPIATSSASYTNTVTQNAFGPSRGPIKFELYETGLDTTWELDLYGRVRQSVSAAKATQEAVQAQQDALRVTLRAEVALHYLVLRGAQAQLQVAERNAKNQAESLRIAEASLKGGRGTQLDVARARAQWTATLATIPQFQNSIDQSAHRIAVLCGSAPGSLRASLTRTKAMPSTPAKLSLAQPSQVLRQRPDVRVAERQLAAATARIGVATADLFPRVTFNGSVGLQAFSLSGANSTHSFGPRLTWPAFDLTRTRQQIKAAGARAEAALADYEQTVLTALEETENALTAFERERQRLHFLGESAKAAEEAAGLARQRYQDGVATFLDVLDAERVALAAQSDVVASEVRLATTWVGVNKAMAW